MICGALLAFVDRESDDLHFALLAVWPLLVDTALWLWYNKLVEIGSREFMKTRNIALDLYRIFCMFLITTIHMVNYSDLMTVIPGGHLNFWLVNGIQVLQVFSISGFTLISAYYLVDKPFRLRRILRFALTVIFFSVVIYLLSLILVRPGFSVLLAAKSFSPLLLTTIGILSITCSCWRWHRF